MSFRGAVKPRAIFEECNPNWPCPSPAKCVGHIEAIKKKVGKGEFGSCEHRVHGDPDSCQVTTAILQRSSDHPKLCLVCNAPAGKK